MSARLIRASTTTWPDLARNAGAADGAKRAGVTQSDGEPPSVRSARTAFLRSSCAGRPFDGNGDGCGKGAERRADSFEVASRAIGRGPLPSCSRISEVEPGGAVA